MIAPVPQNETARLEALLACAILDTPPEAAFDVLAAEIARALDVPIAVIGFIDQERHWFKAKFGTEISQNKRQWATCAHTIYQGSTLACENIAQEPRFTDMPPLSALGLQAYAGTPIWCNDLAVGTVCVFDYAVRPFSQTQLEALQSYALRISDMLKARPARMRLLEQIRQTQRPQSSANLQLLGHNRARITHHFTLPQTKHWQLWAMRPTDTNPYKLESFRGSSLDFFVPAQTQLVLLSLESDHTPSEEPTEVLAVLRLELPVQTQVQA